MISIGRTMMRNVKRWRDGKDDSSAGLRLGCSKPESASTGLRDTATFPALQAALRSCLREVMDRRRKPRSVSSLSGGPSQDYDDRDVLEFVEGSRRRLRRRVGRGIKFHSTTLDYSSSRCVDCQ